MTIHTQGKVAVVTGGTKGIGRGICAALAESGSRVVVVSRHQAQCDQTAEELSRDYNAPALGIAADITDLAQIETLADRVVKVFGRIDILVNNAGSAVTKEAESLTMEDWNKVLDLDLRAVFFCSQILGRHMIEQKHGKIINIASVLGLRADKRVLPYCVAKGGVLQLTRALALEWARYNIQINAICPGYVITEINQAELADEKISSAILRKIPVRRFGTTDEIAGAAVYLASEASNYVSGQHIVVDGGWCAG